MIFFYPQCFLLFFSILLFPFALLVINVRFKPRSIHVLHQMPTLPAAASLLWLVGSECLEVQAGLRALIFRASTISTSVGGS